MARLLADLMQSPASAGPQVASGISVRRCQSADYARIADICRGVYGGSDYMPRMIQHFDERPETTVLVSERETVANGVEGVVCGHKRGTAYFLFGLRVAEEARGKGVARALMEAVCQCSEEFGPVQQVITATIPQNPTAIHLFNTLGFQHTHTVDMWPSYDALSQYEQTVGWKYTGVPPTTQELQEQLNMVDVLGVRDMLSEVSAAMGVHQQDWVQCSSQQQLQDAITSVRVQQLKQAELQQVPCIVPLDYLPWVYEAFPLDAPWTQERLQEGQIWLLPHSQLQHSCSHSDLSSSNGNSRTASISSLASLSSTAAVSDSTAVSSDLDEDGGCAQQYAAIVVIGFSAEFRRYCAGVMTVNDAYLSASLDFVSSQLPHLVCFCDRGTRHSSGKPDPDVVLPAVITATGRHSCFTVYARGNASKGV